MKIYIMDVVNIVESDIPFSEFILENRIINPPQIVFYFVGQENLILYANVVSVNNINNTLQCTGVIRIHPVMTNDGIEIDLDLDLIRYMSAELFFMHYPALNPALAHIQPPPGVNVINDSLGGGHDRKKRRGTRSNKSKRRRKR